MRLVVVAAALALAAPVLAAPPQVTGHAWLVENGSTGEVLLAHDARQRVAIASITKLMTVLLTLEHARLNDVVTVTPEAAAVGESSAGLEAGDRLTVRELLQAALIQSANDAADALAHDVVFLARLLMHRPVVRQIVRQRAATISGGRTLHTWNDLLYSYPGIFGVKTGHTAAAGWSEVAAAHRARVSIYATLLGSPDRATRNADLVELLDWGFSRYVTVRAVTRGHVYAEAELGYGRRSVALVAARSLVATVRVDRPLVRRVVALDAAALPVSRGQPLGQVRIYQRNRLIGAVPLVAARSVASPGLAGRAGWYARRTLHHMAGFFS